VAVHLIIKITLSSASNANEVYLGTDGLKVN